MSFLLKKVDDLQRQKEELENEIKNIRTMIEEMASKKHISNAKENDEGKSKNNIQQDMEAGGRRRDAF